MVKEGIGSLQANLHDSELRLLPAHHDGARGTLPGLPALQVTSNYTLLSDKVCTLRNILYLLSGDDSIDKTIL